MFNKRNEEKSGNKAVAFLNWSLPSKNGVAIKGDKGFPIFQNPEYPSKGEDMLIALAKKYGGAVELNMRVTVRLNQAQSEINLDDVVIAKAAA